MKVPDCMQVGEKATLRIPSTIRASPTLIFEVDLIEISGWRSARWSLDDKFLIQTAKMLKKDGKAKFKANLFKKAEKDYKDALGYAETVKNDSEKLKKLKAKILQNMSVCTNNTQNFYNSIQNCTRALELDDKAFGALYTRSLAFFNLKQWDEAMADVDAAIKLNPNNKILRAYHALVRHRWSKSTAGKTHNEKNGAPSKH